MANDESKTLGEQTKRTKEKKMKPSEEDLKKAN